MPQPNSPEITPEPEKKPNQEPEHHTKLSNVVWEAIKEGYTKPMASAKWVEGNVLAPAYNEAIVRPVNTVIDKAEMLHAPIKKLDKADVPDAPINSTAFYVQNAATTAAGLGAQLIAGHFAGKMWRSAGESVAREAERQHYSIGTASTIRNFASSRMLHNVTGAVGYSAFIDPEQGQSRTGNAVSAGVGMLAFEGSGKLIGNAHFLDPIAAVKRAALGAPIGASQQFLSTLITTGKVDTDASHYDKAMAAGAFSNVIMPGMMKGLEAVAPKLGSSTYADTFAEQQHARAIAALKPGEKAEPGSWADPVAARLAVEAGKTDITAKAKSSDTDYSNIDHLKNLITLRKGDSPAVFVEENAHIKLARDPEFEKGFADAGKLAKAGKEDEARQEYINTRVAQEVAAHKARVEAVSAAGTAGETTSINPAVVAREYAQKFADEANKFISSQGAFRPAMSFSHGGGGGHEGVVFTQNVGIAPHPGSDGSPHTVGDTGATREGEASAAKLTTAAIASRREILSTFPPGSKNLKPEGAPGHEYGWPDAKDGVTVLGHDHVKSIAWKDANLSELTLYKIDPVTKQVSSIVKNYAEPQNYVLDDKSVGFTFTEKEQNLYTAVTTFKIDSPGTWNLPKGAKWDVAGRRINLEIGGHPVWVDSILRHEDSTGRIEYGVAGVNTKIVENTVPQATGDYPEKLNPDTGKMEFNWKPGDPVEVGQDKKPAFFLYQRAQERPDGSISKYIYDPRKLDPNFPKDQLTPDASVDAYSPDKPLTTSLGNFENVYRFPDELRYLNDDSLKIVHFADDHLHVTSWKEGDADFTYEKVPSIKENYPDGRDTQWGEATSIEIKPKSMVVTLKNGGTVELVNSKIFPDGAPYEKLNADGTVDERFANARFGPVRRIDTAPATENADGTKTPGQITLVREINTPAGRQYSTVIVPPRPIHISEVPGLDVQLPNFKIDAYEQLPGDNNAKKFFISDEIQDGKRVSLGVIETKKDGFQTDNILRNGPYRAVWRHPGGLAFMNNVENGASNWTKSAITFNNPSTNNGEPMLVINRDIADVATPENSQYFQQSDLADAQGLNKPLVTESYPKGHATPWGVALNRETFYDGSARMAMENGTFVIVDEYGSFKLRIPKPEQ